MPSEKREKPPKVIEWILLTEDQIAVIVEKATAIAEVMEESKPFDGYTFVVRVFRTVIKHVPKSKRISSKQLAFLQKSFESELGEDLYVPGLEFYLIQNHAKMEQKRKERETRAAREAAKNNGN